VMPIWDLGETSIHQIQIPLFIYFLLF